MTAEEFETGCGQICPHCKDGNAPRFRSDTQEWCHDFTRHAGTAKQFSHLWCFASDFRKANG